MLAQLNTEERKRILIGAYRDVDVNEWGGYAVSVDGVLAAWGDASLPKSPLPPLTGVDIDYFCAVALGADGSVTAWYPPPATAP